MLILMPLKHGILLPEQVPLLLVFLILVCSMGMKILLAICGLILVKFLETGLMMMAMVWLMIFMAWIVLMMMVTLPPVSQTILKGMVHMLQEPLQPLVITILVLLVSIGMQKLWHCGSWLLRKMVVPGVIIQMP